MRTIHFSLLLAVLLLATPTTIAQAVANPVSADDRTVYDTLYREKLATVRRTRSTADDIALATEMMAFAKDIPDDRGVQCLIFIDTIPLASAGSDIKMMLTAAKQLDSLWPDHPALAPNSLIDQANRAYRAADRTNREEVGESYLTLLLTLADRAEQQQDIEEAISLCRQANTIARAIDSNRRSTIEKALDRLAAESALTSRVQMLSLSVRKNPQNSPAARELVDLLLTKRDDPVSAAEFVESTQDEDLIEVVQFCANGIDRATPPAAMRVADWYLASAEDEEERYAEPLLRRSVDWYERFIAHYTREDALAKRVETLSKIAQVRLDQIVQKREDAMFGKWIDLVNNYFEPELHTLGEEDHVETDGSAVEIDEASIILPVAPRGSYEMRVAFTTHHKHEERDSAFILHVPVGPTAVTLHYHLPGELVAWIYRIEESYSIEGRESGARRLTQLLFQVTVIDDETVEIAVKVDGNKAMHWRGPAEELSQQERFLPPEDKGSVIRLSCPSNTTFHKIELRVRKE